MKTPFIWLGSGRARKRDVGSAGRFLDTAARSGLPVPPGGILLDAFYRLALEHALVEVRSGYAAIDDPDFFYNSLYEGIRFPHLDGPVRVRGLFSLPDDPSTAPGSPAQQNVDPDDGLALANAFAAVWQAALSHGDTLRRDTLVQQQIDAQTHGTAVLDSAYARDLVTVDADSAVSETLALPRLELFPTGADLPGWAQRLQKLLRGLRRSIDGESRSLVEWADDGSVCWLLHVDVLQAPPARNDRLTRITLGDLLPALPSPFLTSALAEAGRLYATRCHTADPTFPADAELIVLAAQRPWFNQTLIDDTRLRHVQAPFAARLKRALGRAPAADLLHSPDSEPLGSTFSQVVAQYVTQLVHSIDHYLQLTHPGPARPDMDAASVTSAYDKLHGRLLLLADTAVDHGQISGPEALWLLTADEVRALDAGVGYSATVLAERATVHARLKTHPLPDTLHRFDVPDLPEELPTASAPDPLVGRGVFPGTVSGRAWILTEPGSQLPTGFLPHATILVAPSIDAHWLATLSLVAGVVLENGETAAELLADVELPAVVRVPNALQRIAGGSPIRLDGTVGHVWMVRP